MFIVDDMEIKELEKEMAVFARRAMPFVTKQTLNSLAFGTMKRGRHNVRDQMVNRNKWTAGSVRAQTTNSLNINTQVSRAGSTETYMRVQEEGGVRTSTGRFGLPIPTGYSAGQEGQRPRSKVPRRAFQNRNIKLKGNWKASGDTDGQRMVRTVQDAVDSGNRLVFLTYANRKVAGIFKVVGGKKGTKRGWPKGAKIKMIQNLEFRNVRIPKNEWLTPAAQAEVRKNADDHYRNAMIFQLKRTRLFQKR